MQYDDVSYNVPAMKRPAAAAGLILCAALAQAQSRADALEQQLRALTAADRAHALTELTDLLANDSPRKAIQYGEEALQWYGAHPEAAYEVRTLDEIAWAYMIVSDYARAVASAEKGRDLAQQHGDRKGLARALNNLGVIAQRRGSALDAVALFTTSLDLYRQLGAQAEIAASLNNLGFVYSTELADYDRALSYQLESLKLSEALGDKAAIALSLNNLGIISERTGDPDKALDYFQQALELRRNSGARNRIAATLTNIGDVYLERGDYAKALDAQRQALALRRQAGDNAGVAASLRSLGTIYSGMGQNDLARKSLSEGLQIAEQTGDRGMIANCLLGLSRVSRQQGRAREAIDASRRALAIAQAISARELTRRGWEELAASQEQVGDTAGALASYKRFKAENDRIFDEDKSRRVEALERRYQFEKHESEIARLKGEEAVRTLAAGRQRFQLNLIAGSALLLAMAGFGIYRRRVESARIAERLSVTDTLTGLKNRRYTLLTIGGDIAAAERKRRHAPVGVRATDADLVFLLIDLDRFKSVNDEFGHQAGDTVLAQVADALRESCRASDTIARWGGDEFLVLSRFTDRRTGSVLAERIRSAVEQRAFDLGDGRTIQRTCSVGFASYPFSTVHPMALTWEQVVAVADQALYQAKRSGANAWVGVSATDAATEERLRPRVGGNLEAWIADGVVTTERSSARD
jgi:two-component system cell cycle response regulator